MHDLQKNLYMGLGAKGVNPMPSPMYLSNVDCVGCHLSKRALTRDVSQAKTYEGTEEACLKCHGKNYKGVLAEVKSLVDDTVSRMEKKIATVSAELKELKGASASESADLADAGYNLNFLKSAKPVHNIYYVSQILRQVDEKITALAKARKITVEDTSSLPIISGGFCATLCHAKVGVKVPAETREYKGLAMPHKLHNGDAGLACTDCHIFGAHKAVKLKQPTICIQCHEGRN